MIMRYPTPGLNCGHIRHWMALAIMLSLLAIMGCRPAGVQTGEPARASARDFTFFVLSDTHIGAEQPKAKPPVSREQVIQRIQANLDRMRQLPGESFPRSGTLAGIDVGTIAVPRGLFILGDLADGDRDRSRAQQQWHDYGSLFPPTGVSFGQQTVPIFAIAGNHDGDPAGPPRRGLAEHNRALKADGHLAALSEDGAHFAIKWNGVNLVCLTLCPADTTDQETPFRFGKPGPGSWNDPQMALSFLAGYLRQHVERSGEPVILMQHYGFDDFSLNDWNWWTAKQRRVLYDLLADYNVVAIVHGHNHHAEHYRWPDPQRHAADMKAMFGDKIPATLRQYSVLSCGGVCWVIRIRGNELIAAHLRGPNWSTDPAAFARRLEPAR